MAKSRNRLAADWFAKFRLNAATGELEQEDVLDATTTLQDSSLAKTGGTMTGPLYLDGTGLAVVGATAKNADNYDAERPTLQFRDGMYPHLTLDARLNNAGSASTNTTHGPVLSFVSALGSGFRRWGMGTASSDAGSLSFGCWDDNNNPHYSMGGNAGYTSTGSKMWLSTSGNLQTTGSMTATSFHGDGSSLTNISGGAGATSIVTFTSSGTWTKPSWCKRIRVQVVGGGGGAAGFSESGGAGGYSEEVIDNPPATVAVTVGGGGGSVQYYAAAGDGGTSSFGTYCSSTGGYGSNRNSSHSGGAGGSGSGGQVAFRGGGGTGHTNSNGSGSPAKGGGSYFGGGAGDDRGASNAKIQNGAPGSGGPGSRGDTSWRGAPGESGVVVIYQYE